MQAAGVVTLVFYLASYNCFLWIPKVTAGTFFGFVFGFVFYSFWACAYGGFAVVQAAGLGHLGCALWVSLW